VVLQKPKFFEGCSTLAKGKGFSEEASSWNLFKTLPDKDLYAGLP